MITRLGGKLGRSIALLALVSAIPAAAAVNSAPIANAGPNRTGTVNVAITLNGSGSSDPGGTIVAYWWSFGDGGAVTTSTATVAHTYTATGTYTVTLWVRDNGGMWSTASDTAQVIIGTGITPTTTTTTWPPTTTTLGGSNQAPIADAGANQATQTLISLTFNGSASRDPDGTITMANWTFGDGTSAAGLIVTHSYAAAGTYTATLSVIDNRGRLDTDTATVTVANRPPTANAGPNVSGTPGSPVSLNGSGSQDPDGTIVTYAWTFGDGTTGTGANASHAYATAGTYTATLTVTDNKGANASDSALVTVNGTGTGGTWSRAMGSTSGDAGSSVAADAAGNVFVGGSYRGTVAFGAATYTSAGGADWFVVKYSPSGVPLWARSMGGPGDDLIDGIAVDDTGAVVVVGRFVGSASLGGPALVANGNSDMAVAKYAGTNGAHQWSKRFGGVYDDNASAVAVDGGGNVYFTGYFSGTINFGGANLVVPFVSDLDVFVAKLTSAGAHVWSKKFTNNGTDRGYGIAVDDLGGLALVGSFTNTINFGGSNLLSPNAMVDGFVAKLNTATGAHQWSRQFGAPDDSEAALGVTLDAGGNVIMCGYAASKPVNLGGGTLSALGGVDAVVARYAATSGAHLWSRRLGGTAADYAYGVAVAPDGGIIVTGIFGNTASFGGASLLSLGYTDVYVAKYSSTGAPGWARGLGGTNIDTAQEVAVAPTGEPLVAGYFSGTGTFGGSVLTSAGMTDAFVTRLAP